MPQTTLTLISSMATQALLTDLMAAFERQQPGLTVALTAVGGVDAARRVQAGEAFDMVALAADAIEKLASSGRVVASSRIDLARSAVVVGIPDGTPVPDVSSEAALKAAVLVAPSIGCSTGPSGVRLAQLFEHWGIAAHIAPRIVTPPPGTSVASLIARGEVALGFQQRSEMVGVPGVQVIGDLPQAVQIITTFCAARASASQHAEAVQSCLQFMASPATEPLKRRHGMNPA